MANPIHSTKIVAFTGYKGSGKDTVADHMQNILMSRSNLWGVKMNFATPVKALCEFVYGLTDKEMNDPALKEVTLDRWPFKSPRFLMQEIATDMLRNKYPDVWVKYWERHFSPKGRAYTFLTDLRFPNEYEILTERKAYIVKVVRSSVVQTDLHESESYYDQIIPHFLVPNDKSIEYLRNLVEQQLVPRIKDYLNAPG